MAKNDKDSELSKMIVTDGHPALRKKSEDIPPNQINTASTQSLIQKMKDVLRTQHDGIGLAAPQIGVNKRVFIVSGKIFGDDKEDAVFINPVITKASKEKKWMEGEGCLSVRWIYGKVQRSLKVTIKAYNEKAELISRGASGLLAHIFQHEIDHLDGILFIDKAKDLEKIPPPKEINVKKEAVTRVDKEIKNKK
jgi:peptide deformylase